MFDSDKSGKIDNNEIGKLLGIQGVQDDSPSLIKDYLAT
jgi:hypothetical protein